MPPIVFRIMQSRSGAFRVLYVFSRSAEDFLYDQQLRPFRTFPPFTLPVFNCPLRDFQLVAEPLLRPTGKLSRFFYVHVISS